MTTTTAPATCVVRGGGGDVVFTQDLTPLVGTTVIVVDGVAVVGYGGGFEVVGVVWRRWCGDNYCSRWC